MINFSEFLEKIQYDTPTQLKTGLIVAIIIASIFTIYNYNKDAEYSKNAILPTDRVATTVKVDYMYGDKKHSVDLVNIHTGEKYFDIPISTTCPMYFSFNQEEPIDVIRIDFIDGRTETTWSEFDGLYQKVCGNKIMYNHSEANKEEPNSENNQQLQ